MWLLIDEIALLTDIVKQTIRPTYVKCCADSFRLFRCIFVAPVSFLFAAFIHLLSVTIQDGETQLNIFFSEAQRTYDRRM